MILLGEEMGLQEKGGRGNEGCTMPHTTVTPMPKGPLWSHLVPCCHGRVSWCCCKTLQVTAAPKATSHRGSSPANRQLLEGAHSTTRGPDPPLVPAEQCLRGHPSTLSLPGDPPAPWLLRHISPYTSAGQDSEPCPGGTSGCCGVGGQPLGAADCPPHVGEGLSHAPLARTTSGVL